MRQDLPYPRHGSAFLTMGKLERLKNILKGLDSALLAYSGGADSTFLLKAAKDVLGNKLLAVTADSATYPRAELVFAKGMAKRLKARHEVIKTGELKNKDFFLNPASRCYFCKRELFLKLKGIARKNNLKFIIDASNVSDKKDLRPGSKAKKELGVRSPLVEAGFTKDDIRSFSKSLGLSTWDKPSLACLASRIPYGTRIGADLLKRVEKAEVYLAGLGFRQVRVRHYGGLCRIEVPDKDIPALISKRNKIVAKLLNLGYNYITVDLQGYRTGSINEGR